MTLTWKSFKIQTSSSFNEMDIDESIESIDLAINEKIGQMRIDSTEPTFQNFTSIIPQPVSNCVQNEDEEISRDPDGPEHFLFSEMPFAECMKAVKDYLQSPTDNRIWPMAIRGNTKAHKSKKQEFRRKCKQFFVESNVLYKCHEVVDKNTKEKTGNCIN